MNQSLAILASFVLCVGTFHSAGKAMKTVTGSKLAAAIGLSALALAWMPAHADDFNFNLGSSNLGTGYTGPFTNVDVNLTGSTATITFTSLTNGGFLYLLAGQGAVAVNVSGTYSLGSTITGSNSAGASFTPGPYTDAGSGAENGWGKFNQTIDSFDGFQHSATQVSFTITATGTNSWANAASVLAANSTGSLAAAHVFACATTCTFNSVAAKTGYSAGSGGSTPPTEIPEPDSSSLALLALGLLGAGFWPRRKA